MWPFKRQKKRPYASRAIAYLKPCYPNEDDDDKTLKLTLADSPVIKQFSPELIVTYVIDEGSHFAFVQNRDLAEEALSSAQLHEAGLRNLLALTSNGRLTVHPHGDIFAVIFGGNFEASLLLINELWNDSFRQFVKGQYLAALPNRDVLAFCDRSSSEGRKELLQVIDRLKDSQDHPLTKRLYTRVSDTWVPEESL